MSRNYGLKTPVGKNVQHYGAVVKLIEAGAARFSRNPAQPVVGNAAGARQTRQDRGRL
ncbi:MAG: hypothetical protein LBF51_01170 [Zoogloeaceae bacterium]|jgi:hypothetical protein|nr:hypothetical protein [Zoogloeaceae bacterium]